MRPEPANCPLCKTAAERTRKRAPNGFVYTCPVCGSFEMGNAALSHAASLGGAVRADLRRLREYGYRPRIDFNSRDGMRIGPADTSRS